MRKFFFTMIALLGFAVSSQAMGYEQARQQALFLADKMAYELNLSEEQYEAVYEINLDYLMGITTQDDLYGLYWEHRNADLEYILLDWQYRMYLNATYFYRPLYWADGFWHFGVYARYPHRDYFYFGCPHFYHVYRGGHAWHMNGGHSWYHGREVHRGGHPAGSNGHYDGRRDGGMRDGFHDGHYGRGGNIDRGRGNSQSGHRGGANAGGTRGGSNSHSSTRVTAGNERGHNNVSGQTRTQTGRRDGAQRNDTFSGSRETRTDHARTTSRSTSVNRSSAGSTTRSSSSSVSRSSSSSRPSAGASRSVGGSHSGASHSGGGSHGGGSHGGGRR